MNVLRYKLLLIALLIVGCGEQVREEITQRYDDGSNKLLVKYKGEGSDEVVVERITYSESGDTFILEKPLEKFKMVREYYENGQIEKEQNYKDGKLDGKVTYYYKNGQIEKEENYKDVACPPKVVPSVKLVVVQTARKREYDT